MKNLRLVLVVVLLLVMAIGAQADVIVKMKSSGKMMGMMEMEMTITEYVRGDRSAAEDVTKMTGGMMAMLGGEGSETKNIQIYRLDKGISWSIDVENESYREIPLELYREVMEETAQEGNDDMMDEAEKYEWTVDVKTEDKPVDINGFKCKGIITTAKGISTEDPNEKTDLHFEYWYSKDVKGYGELMQYRDNFAEATGMDVIETQKEISQMFTKFGDQFEEMFENMQKAEGYPIKTVVTIKGSGGQMSPMGDEEMEEGDMPPEMMEMMKGMMGGGEESEDGMNTVFSITNVVESIEQKSVEDSKFEIPEGFSKDN